MATAKIRRVEYADASLKLALEALAVGTADEQELHRALNKALDALFLNPEAGVKIQRNRWPKVYPERFCITSLWKYDLPKGWRLIYTVKKDELEIISIILEWFSHKEYEKRFGY